MTPVGLPGHTVQVIKNVIEDKKEKCDGKWKTVEFPFEEVANLEKVLKNMEAKMSYVIENLTVRVLPPRTSLEAGAGWHSFEEAPLL